MQLRHQSGRVTLDKVYACHYSSHSYLQVTFDDLGAMELPFNKKVSITSTATRTEPSHQTQRIALLMIKIKGTISNDNEHHLFYTIHAAHLMIMKQHQLFNMHVYWIYIQNGVKVPLMVRSNKSVSLERLVSTSGVTGTELRLMTLDKYGY